MQLLSHTNKSDWFALVQPITWQVFPLSKHLLRVHYQNEQKQGGLELSVRDGRFTFAGLFWLESGLQTRKVSRGTPSLESSWSDTGWATWNTQIRSVFCLLLNKILHYVLMRCSDSASPTSAQREESLESRQTLGPKTSRSPSCPGLSHSLSSWT